VAITSCTSTSNGWRAQGTAKGANGRAATYTITIFFTTAQATVQAYGSAKVVVGAGTSGTWSVAKAFRADPNTRCLIRGAG
jgi:hypothetical protein